MTILLKPQEPGPVITVNAAGRSRIVLIGDHAGNAIPEALGDLGLAEPDRTRHIAWDIGVAALGERLAPLLDAVFVRQRYSRLVIDCNREPGRPDAIPETSDGSPVPANRGLDLEERAARVAAIHAPYQEKIAATLDARPEPILVALHSFTPSMGGVARRWHAGILHNGGEDRLASSALGWLQRQPELVIGDNEPYVMAGTDYTVPRHAIAHRRPYIEFEIRQDLIADVAGQTRWAGMLAACLAEITA